MKKVRNQTRETIEELEGTYTQITGPNREGELSIYNEVTKEYELWVANDYYAGYVIVIDGIGYEFVR